MGGPEEKTVIGTYFRRTNGGGLMTEEMIKEIKHIQQCLINVDMEGEDYEEKMDAVHSWRMW